MREGGGYGVSVKSGRDAWGKCSGKILASDGWMPEVLIHVMAVQVALEKNIVPILRGWEGKGGEGGRGGR